MGPPILLGASEAPGGRWVSTWSTRPGRRVQVVTTAPPGDPATAALLASVIIPALERARPAPEEGT